MALPTVPWQIQHLSVNTKESLSRMGNPGPWAEPRWSPLLCYGYRLEGKCISNHRSRQIELVCSHHYGYKAPKTFWEDIETSTPFSHGIERGLLMHATLHLVAVWVCKKTSQSSLQMSLSLSRLPLSTCVTVFAVSHRATQFFFLLCLRPVSLFHSFLFKIPTSLY